MRENLSEIHSNTRISDKDCYEIVFRLLSLPKIEYILNILNKKKIQCKKRESPER